MFVYDIYVFMFMHAPQYSCGGQRTSVGVHPHLTSFESGSPDYGYVWQASWNTSLWGFSHPCSPSQYRCFKIVDVCYNFWLYADFGHSKWSSYLVDKHFIHWVIPPVSAIKLLKIEKIQRLFKNFWCHICFFINSDILHQIVHIFR